MAIENIPSKATFNRMPAYLKVLREMKKEKRDTVSSVTLAEAFSPHGLDNLTVPAVAALMMEVFI